MTLYAESSAVLAWLLAEPAGASVLERFEKADDIVTSRLGQILHSRCIERWQRDDTDDATAKFSD